MSIRPIDIISMPNRSQGAAQVHHEAIQRSQQAHSQLNNIFSKDVIHNSKQTIKTTKSENNEYRYDAKEKGNNSYEGNSKKKKKKDDKANTNTSKNNNGKSGFDIMI